MSRGKSGLVVRDWWLGKAQGQRGVAAVDQARTVDKRRLVKRIGTLPRKARQCLLNTLAEVFAD